MDNKKADRLKRLMLELNLKQSDIARDCGVSSQYISAVLNNKRPMSDRLIERVAYRYKINQDWITYGVGWYGHIFGDDMNDARQILQTTFDQIEKKNLMSDPSFQK